MNDAPALPTEIGESVRFDGLSSGNPVTVTKSEASAYDVRYDLVPTYVARLDQDGRDSFTLTPAPGVAAVGGGPDTWQFFYEHF